MRTEVDAGDTWAKYWRGIREGFNAMYAQGWRAPTLNDPQRGAYSVCECGTCHRCRQRARYYQRKRAKKAAGAV